MTTVGCRQHAQQTFQASSKCKRSNSSFVRNFSHVRVWAGAFCMSERLEEKFVTCLLHVYHDVYENFEFWFNLHELIIWSKSFSFTSSEQELHVLCVHGLFEWLKHSSPVRPSSSAWAMPFLLPFGARLIQGHPLDQKINMCICICLL